MQIILNYENDAYIYNLAFVKALLIEKSIEQLKLNYSEKQELKRQVLEYLKMNNRS